ncbi:PepSY domain-containing protein [Azospirillum thermophilum]|uniref:Peptidase n=1 Tax=Azospirillum thermophilum TaxID=2202148 RepID=A0A2S2CT82_9PROT|nr:PepSY domain-containing protein [Azospirillum thermophilum]AWK87711.1 peptidase [Azospirillum thermophilum]
MLRLPFRLVPSVVLILAGLLVLPGAARADREDHDRAREALRAGRILPLEGIVDKAVATFGGTVLDVEIEEHDHDDDDDPDLPPFVYEIKLLTPGGRIMKLVYDAASGELLAARGRRSGHHGRPPSDRPQDRKE